MRKGQRGSRSFCFGEKQRSALLIKDRDPKDGRSLDGRSSEKGTAAAELDSEVEEEDAEKERQRCSNGDEIRVPSGDQETAGGPPTEEEDSSRADALQQPATEYCVRLKKQDSSCETSRSPTRLLGIFRPQELWLSMTRCLPLRWPSACPSLYRQQRDMRVKHLVDLRRSESRQSSSSSDSANGSPSSTSTSDTGGDAQLVGKEEEEVSRRRACDGPPLPPGRGGGMMSYSSARQFARAKPASESLLAAMSLERDTFLRVELVDMGEERGDLRYEASWRLSERHNELARGIWLSVSET